MKKVDIFVKVGFVIALAVIYFFWRCEYDPMVTILALVILLGASALTYFQYKKIDEMTEITPSGDGKN